MSDNNTKRQPETRILRSVVIVFAVIFIAVTGCILLHPGDEKHIPHWNPLVLGYTVLGWAVGVVSLFMAIALGVIALSATRVAFLRRLKKFSLLIFASMISLILLNVLISLLLPIDYMESPDAAAMMSCRGSSFFVVDEDFGVRYDPDWKPDSVMEPKYYSDIIFRGQAASQTCVEEPENGQQYYRNVDGNGFINEKEMTECDIFVVGDSYVSPTISSACFWTTFLANKTRQTVYNAGTISYSFQQELLTIQRYGVPMNPKTVIWGYFQGNDLWDAQRFDLYQKSGLTWREFIKDQYGLNYSFPYNFALVRLMRMFAKRIAFSKDGDDAAKYPMPCEIAVGEKKKAYAFYKYYVTNIALSREEIQGSRGWEVCCDSLLDAKSECDKIGARFVIAYFPAKITVLLDQMTDESYWDSFYNYLQSNGKEINADNAQQFRELLRVNRNVQYELLKEFCTKQGIELVDTTKPLQDAAQQGRWPYFSYDTHLNTEGNRVVAETVAKYLAKNKTP